MTAGPGAPQRPSLRGGQPVLHVDGWVTTAWAVRRRRAVHVDKSVPHTRRTPLGPCRPAISIGGVDRRRSTNDRRRSSPGRAAVL
jgi:hypothetical protein